MLIHCWYLQTDTFQTKLLFQTSETKYLLNKSMGCHMESGQHHKESEILWTTGTKILLMMWLVSSDHETGYWPLIGQWWWSTIVYLLMITRTEQWVMSMARLELDILKASAGRATWQYYCWNRNMISCCYQLCWSGFTWNSCFLIPVCCYLISPDTE